MRLSGYLIALGLAAAPIAATAQDFAPETPECIAGANPGGGWDFVCRQTARIMSDLGIFDGTMQVTNMSGGGGGVAYANLVNEREGDDSTIMASSSAITTRLAQGAFPGNTMEDVTWLGTIGTEYGVIAVDADSELQDLPALMDRVKEDPRSVSFGGGSATGGYDHLKVLNAARKAGVEDVRQVKYIAFAGGGEAITQVLSGSLDAFTGDLSEVRGFLELGDVKVLAILAPERLPEPFGDLPTAKEQGIDVVGANWRGLMGPPGMSEEAVGFWTGAIEEMDGSEEWQKTRSEAGLVPLDMTGEEFRSFVSDQIDEIEALSREIGLIQ